MATTNGVKFQEPGGGGSQHGEGDVVKDFKNANNAFNEESHSRRLLRKLIRLDSLAVESLHVKGMEHGLQPASLALVLRMAFQTIGIVYGDLGTSPLYVFSSTFSDGKIFDNDDILGVLSLIIYTLILIPLIKYVFIVLRADDNGEGGTFALYSLICRYAKIGLADNLNTPADVDISSYMQPTLTRTSARAARIKSVLKNSNLLQTVLLVLVLLGTCLVMGDGSLTPAISVLSAIQGIGVQVPSLSSDKFLISITIMVLVVLFMLQRFGTEKVSFLFAPAMLVWFFSIGIIGIYNIVKWDPTIFKSLNPFYIFSYFKRGKRRAWVSLGGVVLCITGTEAMFADLGHFNVRSIQVAFSGLVLPSLCCVYIGQAAFLMKNQTNADVAFVFYRSIPKPIFWPMFVVSTMAAVIASQAMISATYSMIRNAMAHGCFPRVSVIHTSKKVDGQIYVPEINWLLMILSISLVAVFRNTTQIGNAYGIAVVGVFIISTCLLTLVMAMIWEVNLIICLVFLTVSGSIEGVYFSSVLYKVVDGGWVPLAIATCFMIIMYSWNYGTRLKYEFEFSQRLSMEWVLGLGRSFEIARVPGIGLVYTEVPEEVPAIFAHCIRNMQAIHSVLVLVCIRNIAISSVPEEERILIRRIGPPEYRMYRCAVRYGYTDRVGNQSFEDLLFKSLETFIKYEAAEKTFAPLPAAMAATSSVREHHAVSVTVNLITEDDYYVPETDDESETDDAPETDTSKGPQNTTVANSSKGRGGSVRIQDEVQFLQNAKEAGVVYFLGYNQVRCKEGASIFKRFLIDYVYSFCRRNCRRNSVFFGIPRERLLKVGMSYHV